MVEEDEVEEEDGSSFWAVPGVDVVEEEDEVEEDGSSCWAASRVQMTIVPGVDLGWTKGRRWGGYPTTTTN